MTDASNSSNNKPRNHECTEDDRRESESDNPDPANADSQSDRVGKERLPYSVKTSFTKEK